MNNQNDDISSSHAQLAGNSNNSYLGGAAAGRQGAQDSAHDRKKTAQEQQQQEQEQQLDEEQQQKQLGKNGNENEDENENESADESEDPPSVPFLQMFRFADRIDVALMVLGGIMSLGNGATLAAFTVVLGDLFDDLNDPNKDAGYETAMWFLYVAAATFVAGFFQMACFTISSERQAFAMRKAYLQSILSQEVAFFDKSNAGTLSSSVAENSVLFRSALGDKFSVGLQNFGMLVSGFGVGFSVMWELALVIIAIAPLIVMAGALMAKAIESLGKEEVEGYSQAGAVADETFSLIRTVHGLNAERSQIEKYKKGLDVAEKAAIKQGLAQGIGFGSMFFAMFVSYGVAFIAGGQFIAQSRASVTKEFPPSTSTAGTDVASFCQVGMEIPADCQNSKYDSNKIFQDDTDVCGCFLCECGCYASSGASSECSTGGDVITTFFAVLIGAMAIGQAAPSIAAFQKGRAAAAKIFAGIDREPQISDGLSVGPSSGGTSVTKDTGRQLSQVNGEINFENVYFTYPSRKGVPIFQGLNATIPAGKTTALVGESGSGKSTIIALIERFYDVDQGSVTLDGVNIKELDMRWYRSKIALVAQEPVLLSATIRENISFGVPTRHSDSGKRVSDEEIWKALKIADAEEFVNELPDKLETYIGGSLTALSGGQKQRIAIARAIIGNPDILLFDEATSALDENAQRKVQGAIDRLIRESQRTTVVIAHRLSTIRHADKIMVFDRGMLLEQGNHDELMKRQGTYSALIGLSGSGSASTASSSASTDSTPANGGEAGTSPETIPNLTDVAGATESNTKLSMTIDPETTGEVKVDLDAENGPGSGPDSGPDSGPGETNSDEEATGTQKKMPKGSYSRLFKYTKNERVYFLPAILGAVVNGISFPMFALVLSKILTIFFATSATVMKELTLLWSIGFFALAIVVGIANVAQLYYFSIIGFRMTSRLRAEVFTSIVRSETAFFDEKQNSAGALSSLLSTDAAKLRMVVADRTALIAQNTSTILSGMLVAFLASWKLSLIVFALFPLLILGGALEAWIMTGFADENAVNNSAAGHLLNESIMGIRTVVSLSLRPTIVELYSQLLQGPMKKATREGLVAGVAFGFSQFIQFGTYALAFGVGGKFVADGEISFEELNQSFFGIVFSAVTIGQASTMLPDIAKGKSAVKSVFRMLDRKSLIDPLDDENGNKPSVVQGDASFDEVRFAYPSRPTIEIFNRFSLEIKRGETIAIVGKSGSGKSTAVALLQRLYDCDEGSVSLDACNVRDLNVSWLRSTTGIVNQEPSLFSGTIAENIAMGKHGEDVSREEIEDAAKLANAYEFINTFPEGFDTQLSGQLSVSGGQKQRICIARALIAHPNMLLLDEATSALDNTSQSIVQEALDSITLETKRTTVIVAHRLNSVRHADRIFVVETGVIVESGTHHSLLQDPNSAYSKLFAAQMESDNDDSG